MSAPSIVIEIAFASDPFDTTPTWVDVTEDFREDATVERGRSTELDRMETGVCSFRLSNFERQYDPVYESGVYFGQIEPRKQIRISAVFDAITYRIFRGFVGNWQPRYPSMSDSLMEVESYDLMGVLALIPISGVTFPAQSSGDRVDALLDEADVPSAWRNIDGGASTCISDTPDTTILEALQQVAETEDGVVFVDGDGVLQFRDRTRLFTPAVSPTVFGDDPDQNELPYIGIEPSYGDTLLYTRVIANPKGGTAQVQDDATAQARYGLRVLDTPELLLSALDADDRAVGWLDRYKTPRVRIPSITILGQQDDDLWPEVLGNELYDRKIVRRRPPGPGGFF